MKLKSTIQLAALGMLAFLPSSLLAQGPLTPPPFGSAPISDEALDSTGAPKVSMKTLSQTDPGQPIPSRDPSMVDLNGTGPAYHITASGHYFLTQDLIGDTPILIESDGVTLDLRGFEVRYVAGGGAGGVAITSDVGGVTYNRITVKNGRVVGGWTEGIRIGGMSSVKDMEVSGPLSFCIHVGGTSLVEDCQVLGPDEDPTGPGPHSGIWAGNCSVITGCTAREIHGKGIETGNGSTIVDCTACSNLGCGIVGLKGNTVKNSTATRNGVTGIDFYEGNTISDCNASENGKEGFLVRSGSTLQNCVARCNQLEGFVAEPANIGDPNYRNTAVNFLQCSSSENRADGFRSGINTLFTHCTADRNGSPAVDPVNEPGFPPSPGSPATGNGFDIEEGSRMLNCVATNNKLSGIIGGRFNQVSDCTVHSNDHFGIELATDENVIVRNYIRGNTTGAINLAGGSIAPFALPSVSTNPLANYHH